MSACPYCLAAHTLEESHACLLWQKKSLIEALLVCHNKIDAAKSRADNLLLETKRLEGERDAAQTELKNWKLCEYESQVDALRSERDQLGKLVADFKDGVRENAERLRVTESRLAKCLSALEEISDLRWISITDGSGPSDCSPNEKGLLRYVGIAHDIAKRVLSQTTTIKTEEKI